MKGGWQGRLAATRMVVLMIFVVVLPVLNVVRPCVCCYSYTGLFDGYYSFVLICDGLVQWQSYLRALTAVFASFIAAFVTHLFTAWGMHLCLQIEMY